MAAPKILWDIGTCYDFYMSLHVLHKPDKSGLRGKWAAGVRSRLPQGEREILQQARGFLLNTLHWLYRLPEPKDGQTLLQSLAALPSEDRISTLLDTPNLPPDFKQTLAKVTERQAWSEEDVQTVPPILGPLGPIRFSKEIIRNLFTWCTQPAEYGERYLQALQTYYAVFFAEEEQRIGPVLQASLERAQALAQRLDLASLLEELSQGLRYTEYFKASELVLAPSFWSTPLVTEEWLTDTRQIILFGARPATASLVPGEVVPDSLSLALKALADPTRLRILRYLGEEPLTPTELARRLRLRPPTVIHHLHTLRLAGLVYITLSAEDQRRYTARLDGVALTFKTLKTFLGPNNVDLS